MVREGEVTSGRAFWGSGSVCGSFRGTRDSSLIVSSAINRPAIEVGVELGCRRNRGGGWKRMSRVSM